LRKEEVAQRTYYRANTRNTLLSLRKAAAFGSFDICRAGNPEYAGFCKPAVFASLWLEKLADKRYLNAFKMYLCGCFIK